MTDGARRVALAALRCISWIPAFAGMTVVGVRLRCRLGHGM